MLKQKKNVFTYLSKNTFVLLLVILVHIIALFTSPVFLGPNYSTKTLIDEYCKNSLNGGSLVLKTAAESTDENLNKINTYREKNETEFNTTLGLSLDNVNIDGKTYTFVSSRQSEKDYQYNNYRVYSYTGWRKLETENHIYISDDTALLLEPDAKNPKDKVLNKEVQATIKGTTYTFKIGGVYSSSVVDEGWRSRGKYFEESFQNCIFIHESFLVDKFDGAFQMFTSETAESGNIYKQFLELNKSLNGTLSEPTIASENQLFESLNVLTNKKRNTSLQGTVIVVTVLALLFDIFVSIYVFDPKRIIKSFKDFLVISWCVLFAVFSYLFVFLTKAKMINVFGFFAYGANKASLNIVSIYLILLFVGIAFKTFIANRKLAKASVNETKADEKAKILFITKAKFPDQNAFATYVESLASIYNSSDYEVICIGNGNTEYKKVQETYFGKFVSLRNSSKNSKISKIYNHLWFEDRVYKFVKKNITRPVHIFFSCEYSFAFYEQIKELFEDIGVKYSFIVTEEYTKDEFEKYNLLSRKAHHVNRYFVNKYPNVEDSFVVISRFLENKISSRGIKCVYVPFSFNSSYVQENKKKPQKHEGINFIYCGSPENKDLLPAIINAFTSYAMDSKSKNIHLNIVGVDEQWAANHGISSFNKDFITFHGRKDKDFVFNAYSMSDYSVLLRDESKLFAQAGFPTKISESMMLGVVPITNLTSNLSEYLNSDNAIIVKESTEESMIQAIKHSIDEFGSNSSRRASALKTAKDNFDIEKYKNGLLSLVEK